MRIHEIITELDPSRRSFLKTVGKTAAGVAGAAALGNLATGTASARDTWGPETQNAITDLARASYRAIMALEAFDDNPSAQTLSAANNSLKKYNQEREQVFQVSGNDIIELGVNVGAIGACTAKSKFECNSILKNHERIKYLHNKTRAVADKLLAQQNKK